MTVASKTFPISFTSVYQVIGGIANSTYIKTFAPVYITVNSITNTGFTNPDTSGYIGGKRTWIAFGIQQWGYFVDGSGTSSYEISLPLSINTLLFASIVGQQPAGPQRTEGNPRVSPISSTKVYMNSGISSYRDGIFWFVIAIQQWGYHKSNSSVETINFHIAYNNSCFGITGEAFVADNTADISPIEITNNSFDINPNYGHKFYWLSYGVQQWGASAIGHTTLPIAFSNATWVGAAVSVDSAYDYTCAILNKSKSSFDTGSWGTPYDYIAIGKQQWGSTTSNNMALPISFSTVFGGVGARYTTSGYSGINSITTNKVTFGYERSSFIAVGKQQWGKGNTTTSRDNTVTLPVSYVTSYSCMVAQYISSPSEKYAPQVLMSSTNTTLYMHWGRSYTSGSYVKWFTIGY